MGVQWFFSLKTKSQVSLSSFLLAGTVLPEVPANFAILESNLEALSSLSFFWTDCTSVRLGRKDQCSTEAL